MQKLANEIGFVYIGNTLPSSVPVAGTEIARTSSIWNVIDGERNGIRVVAFDCRFGAGKGSWRRTVIAVHAPRTAFGTVLLEPGFDTQEAAGWTIEFEPRRMGFSLQQLMDIEELEARIAAVGR